MKESWLPQPANIIFPALFLGVTAFLVNSAFSRPVRNQILARDRRCQGEGEHLGYLTAAHINHNRENSNYNNPDNGMALCLLHHLGDHIAREGNNGLTHAQNQYAIMMIRDHIRDYLATR